MLSTNTLTLPTPHRILQQHLLLVALLAGWFMPWTHPIFETLDCITFSGLNDSLTRSTIWMKIWGYLNHPNENWLNVVLMVSLNVLGIITLSRRQKRKAIGIFLYCWLSFQVVLLLTHFIFNDLLNITRLSPSVVIEPSLKLTEAMQNPNIKDYSHNSFPAGHTLVAIYWALFASLYVPKFLQKFIYLVAVIICLSRIFSGAHWASDIIFTATYATLCFYWMIYFPGFKKFIGLFDKRVKTDSI